MKVLLIGSGGREHALAWKLRQSPKVSELLIAPGNAGTLSLGENVPIKADNTTELLGLAMARGVELTVVGPEAPLAAGLADSFIQAGLPIFGASRMAAEIETSKVFSKDFMARHGIPTAAYRSFTEYGPARQYVASLAQPPVIKAGGLAAGKGVIVCANLDEAQEALRQIMVEREFGAAGETVVIEEKLAGQEVSLLAFSDGQRLSPMIPAQDHKAALNGDRGPNTGGMGSYAPALALSEAMRQQAIRQVLEPAIGGMRQEGREYRSVLYAGLMLAPQGLRTLEFNARFGDPETQSLMPLLDCDLAEVMLQCAQGRLDPTLVCFRPGACVCVVMTSGGYPGHYKTGYPIEGIANAETAGCLVFQAGTMMDDSHLVTGGGRVLGITAVGDTLATAIERAYEGVKSIRFQDAHYRTDIGAKGLVVQ